MSDTADRFIRRKGRGRSISVCCPRCGYTQYDVQPSSKRGSAPEIDCAQCHHTAEVLEVSKCE
jgi:hypothetical protein